MRRQPGIVLINPPLSLEQRYGVFSRMGSVLEPLSLGFLAAATRARGIPTSVLDPVPQRLDNRALVRRVKELAPAVVGMTLHTLAVYAAAELARELKRAMPGTLVVVGGHHASALPEDTLERFPSFDAVVIGEGESTLPALLERYPEVDATLPGIVLRGDEGPRRGPERPLIEDLDSLPPPAWDLLGIFEHPYRYRPSLLSLNRLPMASVLFSRGCRGTCGFCSRAVFGRRLRTPSPEYFVDQLAFLRAKGIRELCFQDAAFGAAREPTLRLLDLMARRALGFSFTCQARPDEVDRELLRAMRRAGCWQVRLGVESASRRPLQFTNKHVAPGRVLEAIEACREERLNTVGYFIFGDPMETPMSMEDSIRFARESGLDGFKVNYLTPLPGSRLYRVAREHGRFDEDWTHLSTREIVFVPTGLDPQVLRRYFVRAYLRFYLRPRVLLGQRRWFGSLRSTGYALSGIASVASAVLRKAWIALRGASASIGGRRPSGDLVQEGRPPDFWSPAGADPALRTHRR